MRLWAAPWLLCLSVPMFGTARPAAALIRINLPAVSQMCQTAQTVVIGSVFRVNFDNRVVEVKATRTAKGEPIGAAFRIQIVAPGELIGQVAAGQPAVLFVDRGKLSVVHLADQWLLCERLAGAADPGAPGGPAWRATGVHHDARQSFPGRTVALVRILAELTDGESTLLYAAEDKLFGGGFRQAGKLGLGGQKPQWMIAVPTGRDAGRPDVLVGTAGGVRLFEAGLAGYQDATETRGLAGATGAFAAAGDSNGDGRADLLIGKTLWLNDGPGFVAAKAEPDLAGPARPLAVAFVAWDEDNKPNLAAVFPDGRLRILLNPGGPADQEKPWTALPDRALWTDTAPPLAAAFGDWGDDGRPHLLVVRQGGVTRYALGPSGGREADPPADFERLTGVTLASVGDGFRDGLRNVAATVIDINGDRRPDFLVVADDGSFLLVNRGFGCFLVVPDAAAALLCGGDRPGPFKLGPATPWTAANLRGDGPDGLLLLGDDGTLHQADNPPPAATGAAQP